LTQALRDKEAQLQASGRLENEMHRLESERDKLQLKCQQSELHISKLKQKLEGLESEQLKKAQDSAI